MLDLAGILSTAILMIIVILRAVQLDAREPWFQTVKRKSPPDEKAPVFRRPAAPLPSWRRQA